MTDRQKQILSELIKEYVKSAEPVSSSFLVEKCGFNCSPATIRAEMMSLEKEGLLVQPHTSAGRVPTDKAYRFFVDHLLNKDKGNNLPEKARKMIDQTIKNSPKEPHAISSRLAKATADLSDNFAISGILDTGEFYRVGFSNIFELPEFEEAEDIFGFGSIFDEFERHFAWLFNDFPEDDLQVYIGRENPSKEIKNESVLIARYPLPDGYEGISALIGPMRMAYDRNMAILKYVAKKMGEL